MARPLRIEFPGALYHVTARGNERTDIFKSVLDRKKFLSYLESKTQRYLAVVHAYCLMTNHYHILIETPLGNLSQIMQNINSSYTMYFNVKRKRLGHLLQGRFKAIVVEADAYACELSRYMHLNPVRAGIVPMPEEYLWSSYRAYLNASLRPSWLTTKLILGYFPTQNTEEAYRIFVRDVIGKEYRNPLDNTVGSLVLGSEDFVSELLEEHVAGRPPDRDLPALHSLSRSLSSEMVHLVAAEIISADPHQARKAAIHLCHHYSGLKLDEIGKYFNLSHSGVTQASKRFTEEMVTDKELREKVALVMKRLNL